MKIAHIEVNSRLDCPHAKIWRDYTTHKIKNIECRKNDNNPCDWDNCKILEEK